MVQIYVPKITEATVSRDGLDVLVVMNGRRVIELPWEAALQLARAIVVQARRIEEQVKADKIVSDQALLMRAGAPFGLTSHPDLISEAKKEAAGNTVLRKNLPLIESRESVGTPTVIRHRPKKRG